MDIVSFILYSLLTTVTLFAVGWVVGQIFGEKE